MKIKSKYIFTPVLTLMALFATAMLAGNPAFADTGKADAIVDVLPACAFTDDDATTIIPTAPTTLSNSESISTKPDIVAVCNGLNGWKIQAVGFSPDSTDPTGGVDGNTSMYSPVSGGLGNFIATGTSGTSSYWSFKITSATSATTTATILNGYNNYSNIPAAAVDVANFTGDGAGGPVTGTIRADYQIFVSGGQAPGTYTGKVKYTIAVNP